MTIEEALEILIAYNKWRRTDDEDVEMPSPKDIGKAIDVAISVLGGR
jgi:hypothetical protein